MVTTKLARARTAILVVLGILAVLWIVQIVNNADHYRLSYDGAIRPRQVADLWQVLSAPFLHWSWSHLEGNSVPLVVLGFLAAYRGLSTFVGVTAVVLVTSGLAAWLFASTGSESAGASGVIFGWFGYVIARGLFTRNWVDVVVGVVVMIYYLPIFTLLLPAPHLGYQDHIGGFVGGLPCGWLFRPRPAAVDIGSDSVGARMTVSPGSSRSSTVRSVESELADLTRRIHGEPTGPEDHTKT